MAGVQELHLQVPRREGPSGFLALIGVSLVVLSLVVKPPVQAGCGLAGFLLWLLWAARLLLFGPIGRQCPVSPAALAATTANLAVEKAKCLFFGRQAPPPESEPAAAPA
ncbi:unnamed protein product [Urochloa decumbens]|uniref:Uncharacterized protein n=1 Tax=Urochloa decumbens TaxID=240449 RepID=A0ABC9GLC5_9POAL